MNPALIPLVKQGAIWLGKQALGGLAIAGATAVGARLTDKLKPNVVLVNEVESSEEPETPSESEKDEE